MPGPGGSRSRRGPTTGSASVAPTNPGCGVPGPSRQPGFSRWRRRGCRSPRTARGCAGRLEPGCPRGRRLFLGDREGTAYFALVLDEPLDAGRWSPLREVLTSLPAPELGLAAHAVALAEWHAAHRFCPRCGTRLGIGQGGHVLTCTGCGHSQFPRTDPAVIMLVTDDEWPLPARRTPPGRRARTASRRWPVSWSPGESLEHAVAREIGREGRRCEVDEVTLLRQPAVATAGQPHGRVLRHTRLSELTSTDRRRRDRGRPLVRPGGAARRATSSGEIAAAA